MTSKQEVWQPQANGYYATSLFLSQWRPDLQAGITLKPSGDMQAEEDRKNFCRRLDFDYRRLAVSHQVHGDQIQVITSDQDIPMTRIGGVDGWVARGATGVILGVFGADCPPVFIIHRNQPIAALLHAGWRGVRSGIVTAAGRVLTESFGVAPKDLVAAVGPHIRSCCYEVKEDVTREFPDRWVTRRQEKSYLDLSAGICEQLQDIGIDKVAVSLDCTYCRSRELYSSWRRKDGSSMMSFVQLLG
ncbi:MAG: polyphenol oxidase family protein [Elusimicrobiota bacterium]